MKPQALILRAAGTNCDRELAHAFALAGASSLTIHLNHLIDDPKPLEQADLIGFPGGFSYGDDIAAGRIFANRLRHKLLDPLRAAIARGVPIIGVCNGFQVLVKLGLLPDPAAAPRQTATLADNTSGRFIDQWVSLVPVTDSVCIWTRALSATFDLPIAHGEGRFVPADGQVLIDLRQRHQIALRYATNSGADPGAGASFPGNPNGSVDDIAGICDPSGLVLGLMPHPERYAHATQHPHWTRRPTQDAASPAQTPAGLQFFINAVEHVKGATAQTLASTSR